MRAKKIVFIALVALLVALLASCNPRNILYTGTYVTEIDGSDHTINLNLSGEYLYSINGEIFLTGQYKVFNNQILLNNDAGDITLTSEGTTLVLNRGSERFVFQSTNNKRETKASNKTYTFTTVTGLPD